jgi:hypothetical protein
MCHACSHRRKAGLGVAPFENYGSPRFPRQGACYSCNTLPKRINGVGNTGAFSLCFG